MFNTLQHEWSMHNFVTFAHSTLCIMLTPLKQELSSLARRTFCSPTKTTLRADSLHPDRMRKASHASRRKSMDRRGRICIKLCACTSGRYNWTAELLVVIRFHPGIERILIVTDCLRSCVIVNVKRLAIWVSKA